jgi:putative flavoprotein involved in K+ transport
MKDNQERYDTIVIGGGQAGLATGYYLSQSEQRFVILDGHARIGDAWRKRWDSLRLFTPARLNRLPGMSFPAPAHTFPTKDEMADYLEAYAARFELPVRTGVWVDSLEHHGNGYTVSTREGRFEADNVVVAMANYQQPKTPEFADELDSHIRQLHSRDYRNPSQLKPGGVLVVGVGNSGAEIAMELVQHQPTWLSGEPRGVIPVRIDSAVARYVFFPFILPFVGKYVLTTSTPIGRRVRSKILAGGDPLFRTKPAGLLDAGVQRLPRMTGVTDGKPVMADGQSPDISNVVWATGFKPDSSWIKLPVFDENGYMPQHARGIVASEPGLYFVGLKFLYSMASSVIAGVGRDAQYVTEAIKKRTTA